jgi:uncharacterized membrane protein YqgA involved in biofilm formation
MHNYSGKHFTLYVKNNFRIVLFYSCVFYILLYIYFSSLKNPLKLASKEGVMGYFHAPYWGNLIIHSSFSHIFIKRFSITKWMPCIVLAVYSISVLRFQQYLRRLFLWTIYSIKPVYFWILAMF